MERRKRIRVKRRRSMAKKRRSMEQKSALRRTERKKRVCILHDFIVICTDTYE